MAKRRRKRGGRKLRLGWRVPLVVVLLALGGWWWWSRPRETVESVSTTEFAEAPERTDVEAAREPMPGPIEPVAADRTATLESVEPGSARIALVIDDLGRSVAHVDRLQELGIPWTAAVLPFERRTREVVQTLRARGVEYLCHLPMQPTKANPGPGALRVDMSAEELESATRAALDAVPGASGVNNHMGSVLSADRRAMLPILQELAARRLFFIDSRTSASSVGYRLALELGLPSAERQVFLDAEPGRAAVVAQFDRLLESARTRGAAVAIGHPHPDTFAALESQVARALAAGYEFVPASYLLDRPAGDLEP